MNSKVVADRLFRVSLYVCIYVKCVSTCACMEIDHSGGLGIESIGLFPNFKQSSTLTPFIPVQFGVREAIEFDLLIA